MAGTETAVVRLSDLEDGQEADCFAALVKKVRGTTYKNESFVKCYFRDKRVVVEAPLWADSRFLKQAEGWPDGAAFRLHVRAGVKPRYGLQLEILSIRSVNEQDAEDGYDFFDLVESTDQDPEHLFRKIQECVDRCIDELPLRQLVTTLLHDNADLFKKMPAAASFHHGYTAGLLEHVWSMTRCAEFLARHYAHYYDKLNPPLNKGVIIAATVLHDIGKLRELEYHPVEAKYTVEGCLIGHVLIGRDMVREQAGKIEGFSGETLLLLEHAILAHHGRRDYGAPIVPQTIEALLVSFVDDLDAKMNIAARQRILSNTVDKFTEKVFALDNRRFYKGVPRDDEPDPAEDS
jgi:3'-5' exoribonuclease